MTGGIATGKSTVLSFIAEAGFSVFRSDDLGKVILSPGNEGYKRAVEAFGVKILDSNGAIDRKKLASLMHSDLTVKKTLESIVRPLVEPMLFLELTRTGISESPRPWFFEAAFLYQTGAWKKYRQIWLISCRRTTQLVRLMHRDALSKEDATRRILAHDESRAEFRPAGQVIYTDGTLADVRRMVQTVLFELK